MLQSIRSIDYAARYGGDELIILLVETSAEQAARTAERIRMQVENASFRAGASVIEVTVSIGIAQVQPGDISPVELFIRVDQALYEAKRAGRNQAYCAAIP